MHSLVLRALAALALVACAVSPANGAGCTVLAIVVELTGEDTMKRVVLLPCY